MSNNYGWTSSQKVGLAKRIVCPVCKRPRHAGDLSHGKCAEKLAAADLAKGSAGKTGKHKGISIESERKSKANTVAKRYRDGELREWMFS